MRVPRELLRETVSVEDFSSSGSLGPVLAAARSIRASVQATNELTVNDRGRTVGIILKMVIRPEDAPLTPESKVTYNGGTYRVVESYPVPDGRRPSHYEVVLARWSA